MSSIPPRHWPLGLLGMLALVVSVEFWLARNREWFIFNHEVAWLNADLHVRAAAGCDVVAFGDSLVKQGVVPPVMEQRLGPGRKAYNLAISGTTPITHAILLKRLLAVPGQPPPRALLIDGELLNGHALESSQPWADLFTCREVLGLMRDHGKVPFFTAVVVEEVLPSVRMRRAIQRRITRAVQGEPPDDPNDHAVFLRNQKRNRGAEVVEDRRDPPGADPFGERLRLDGFHAPHWSCDPTSARELDRFLTLAFARGIRVYWLLPPLHPELEARRAAGDWGRNYMAFLHRLQARYPDLIVLDSRRSTYRPESFHDAAHLSRTGAIAYSDALGEVLRTHLDRPGEHPERWIEMPRYDARQAQALAAASPIEDVKQSGANLARVMNEIAARKAGGQMASKAGPEAAIRR